MLLCPTGKDQSDPFLNTSLNARAFFLVQKRRTKGCFQRPARKRKRWQTGHSQPLLVVPAQEEAPQQGCYLLPSSYSIRLAELPLMTLSSRRWLPMIVSRSFSERLALTDVTGFRAVFFATLSAVDLAGFSAEVLSFGCECTG